MLKISKQVGAYTIEAEGKGADAFAEFDSARDAFERGQKCGICGSEGVPMSRKAEGPNGPFQSNSFRCTNSDCRAILNLGKSTDTGGIFCRWDMKWQQFEQKSTMPQREPVASPSGSGSETISEDDIPF